MENIQLPEYDCQIKKIEGELYIFDPVRRKHLMLTPEEWVRQHFLRYLILECAYPKSLMRTESGLKYEQRQKRSDILVYDRRGEPFFLVECKAAHIEITAQTLEQVCEYNYVIKARYIAITNGVEYAAFRFEEKEQCYAPFLGIPVLGSCEL